MPQEQDPGQKSSETADAVKDSQQKKDDQQAEQGAKQLNRLTLLKSLPDLDPEAHPLAVNGYFLIKNKDGLIHVLNPEGEEGLSQKFLEVTVMMPEFLYPDSTKSLMAKDESGQTGSLIFDESQCTWQTGGPGGLGGIGRTLFYDPDTERLYDFQNNPVDLESEYQDAYRQLGENAIVLAADASKNSDSASGQLQDFYAVSLKNGNMFGPVSSPQIAGFDIGRDGIRIYDLNRIYSTVFPVSKDGR
ncbi:MAG: hypothetical protein HUJ54_04930, partial [Erysipelotrichaceae bacterium]|nr:hypothetical protein [Erysipelotrichaceae bacterium]